MSGQRSSQSLNQTKVSKLGVFFTCFDWVTVLPFGVFFHAAPSSRGLVLGGFNHCWASFWKVQHWFRSCVYISLLLVYSVFHSGPVAAWFSSKRFSARTWHPFFFSFLEFLRKKGCQGPPFYRFTLGHLANRHRSEHAAFHFTSLTC
jgi:hypothetical protein